MPVNVRGQGSVCSVQEVSLAIYPLLLGALLSGLF